MTHEAQTTSATSELALVLTGGGARAAYQVGLLRHIARRYPTLQIPILTGTSAGAVNAAHMAQHQGTFAECVDDLVRLWLQLTPESVFRSDAPSIAMNVLRWGWRLLFGGLGAAPTVRGLVDTDPLRRYLDRALRPVDGDLNGIAENLRRGVLKAVAISTTSYTTGQNVVWIQGRDIEAWQRPMRRAVHVQLKLEHVMASTSLPFLFPAVGIGNEWYGDGGIRLSAPLSPALHLGARKILTISTRAGRTREQANTPSVIGYPPPAQVLGVLYNAIFLDLIDQDVVRLQRLNELLRPLPEELRGGLREVDILVLRPSADLGRIARDYEPRLPKAFRFMTRGLGTRKTATPDILSLVMFQADYLSRLIALGEEDAAARSDEIDAFLEAG